MAPTIGPRILTPIQSAPRRPPGYPALSSLASVRAIMPPWSPARADAREALDHGPHHALEERLLQLELLERLGLDDELLQARLDGVLRRAGREADGEEQDGCGRQAGDDQFDSHRVTP